MDATRIFYHCVYCPYDDDNFCYDAGVQLSLEEAWYYYLDEGQSIFAVLNVSSLEYGCDIDMEDLTPGEEEDILRAIKGR